MPLTMHYNNQNIWRDGIVSTQGQRHERFSDSVMEPLGHRSIGGLAAVGTRTTTTRLDSSNAPAGTTVTEIWYAPELEELLSLHMTTKADPQTRATALPSFDLTQVRREDPDPKLFYPPQGYRIQAAYPYSR